MRSCCQLQHLRRLDPYADSCVYCGAVVLYKMPEHVERPKVPYHPCERMVTYMLIKEHIRFVESLVRKGAEWMQIARELQRKGRPSGRITGVAVHKYYIIYKERNSGDQVQAVRYDSECCIE